MADSMVIAFRRCAVFLCVALVGISNCGGAENDALPAISCQVRYHFREELRGSSRGDKQYSAPSYEKEALRAAPAARDGERERVVEGRVAHLPYRFVVKLAVKDTARTIEVNIFDKAGNPLDGFPKTIPNVPADTGASSQEIDVPVTPKLTHEIERTVLQRNQHLTQVQLVIQQAP